MHLVHWFAYTEMLEQVSAKLHYTDRYGRIKVTPSKHKYKYSTSTTSTSTMRWNLKRELPHSEFAPPLSNNSGNAAAYIW